LIDPRARYAYGTVLSLLMAGCSGAEPQGTFPGVRQESSIAVSAKASLDRALQSRSWVDAANPPAVFVSNGLDTVYGYSQKDGRLTEQISGLAYPEGLATDKDSNLYVVIRGSDEVFVYPPGATTPTLTLTGCPSPLGVAVSRTGEVACVAQAIPGAVFYKPGVTTPYRTITTHGLRVNWDAYDSKGNLYLSTPVSLVEIVGGGKGTKLRFFDISKQVTAPQAVAVDNTNHLLVIDESQSAIFQYQLPNPQQPVKIQLTGISDPLAFALTKSEASVWVAGGFSGGGFLIRYPYPAGGSGREFINDIVGGQGIAVTPWAKP
jgi:hypothetical protein